MLTSQQDIEDFNLTESSELDENWATDNFKRYEGEKAVAIADRLRALETQARESDGDAATISPELFTEDDENFLSARVLMIQGQQIMAQELQTQIREGLSLLTNIEERSGLISEYLSSAELDLSNLESKAKASEQLLHDYEDLQSQHQDALAEIEQLKQDLELLTVAKRDYNSSLAAIRSENVRLSEFKRVQQVEAARHQAKLSQAENDKLNLSEKVKLLESDKQELISAKKELEEKLSQKTVEISDAAKDSGSLLARLHELEGTLQHRSDDLLRLREAQAELKSTFNEKQNRLNDKLTESDMKKRELEQLLRLKEKRISELEQLGMHEVLAEAHGEEAKSQETKPKPSATKRKTKAKPDTKKVG